MCLLQKLCIALICDLQVFVCFWNLLRVKDRKLLTTSQPRTSHSPTPLFLVNSSCKFENQRQLPNSTASLRFFTSAGHGAAPQNESTLFVHLARRPRGRFSNLAQLRQLSTATEVGKVLAYAGFFNLAVDLSEDIQI